MSTYAYVNPVVAIVLGWLLAGEALTTRTLLGSSVIVGAVAMVTAAKGPARLGEEAAPVAELAEEPPPT